MALTQDERSVLSRLQSWHGRIEELLALFDGHGQVPARITIAPRSSIVC